jgi:hypothetical protein
MVTSPLKPHAIHPIKPARRGNFFALIKMSRMALLLGAPMGLGTRSHRNSLICYSVTASMVRSVRDSFAMLSSCSANMLLRSSDFLRRNSAACTALIASPSLARIA